MAMAVSFFGGLILGNTLVLAAITKNAWWLVGTAIGASLIASAVFS